MRVTLVQSPRDGMDASELAPPLGLLTLAAILREEDVEVAIVDLNLACFLDRSLAGPAFYERASDRIAATAPDLVGFTSMAIESHVALELARLLKERDPEVKTVMGGPHFSAIAKEVLTFYAWVDFVVTGAGEAALLGLIRALRTNRPVSAVRNLAWMEHGIFRLDRAPLSKTSFSDVPFPAFDLVNVNEYFMINPSRVLDIEHNRGCVLNCSFCYSANHWGRGEQSRCLERLVADLQRYYDLGARHLSFVGDNFLNSQTDGIGVADAIASANPGVTWRCWATLPQLTEDVAEAFGRAGCKYIFVGVDAVSARAKKDFRKSYYRGWPALRRSMERCLDRGIIPACAFLLYPDASAESRADNEEALNVATRVNLIRCGVRLSPLTLYEGTGLASGDAADPVRTSTEKARVLFQGHWMTVENSYAEERPWLFPYHSTIGPPERFAALVRGTHAGHTLLNNFAHTMMQVVHAGHPLWPLLTKTADRVDYAQALRPSWQNQEIEAFLDVIRSSPVTPDIEDTLAFETAEFRLRRTPSPALVMVEVEGTPLTVRLLPHVRVQLSRSPRDYDSTEVLEPPPQGPEQRFLLVPEGPGARYLQPMAGADALIRTLSEAAGGDRAVPLSAAAVASLLAANVIALPSA